MKREKLISLLTVIYLAFLLILISVSIAASFGPDDSPAPVKETNETEDIRIPESLFAP